MKTSFDWNMLKEAKCPNMSCVSFSKESSFKEYNNLTICNHCGFSVRNSKLRDLLKGKESRHYLTNPHKWEYVRNKSIKNKERLELALQIQQKEREWNRRKLERK